MLTALKVNTSRGWGMGSKVIGHVVDEATVLRMDVDDSADSGAGFSSGG